MISYGGNCLSCLICLGEGDCGIFYGRILIFFYVRFPHLLQKQDKNSVTPKCPPLEVWSIFCKNSQGGNEAETFSLNKLLSPTRLFWRTGRYFSPGSVRFLLLKSREDPIGWSQIRCFFPLISSAGGVDLLWQSVFLRSLYFNNTSTMLLVLLCSSSSSFVPLPRARTR